MKNEWYSNRPNRRQNIYFKKKTNAVNSEIEERERDYEIKYPNSYVIIDFRLFDLYKERKRLENELSELKKFLPCGYGILF